MYGVIYTLIDGTNDKEYVGQTVRPVEVRFYQHEHGDQYIDRMIQEHGADMFETAILKTCDSQEELDYWEKRLIKSRNTMYPNGYNLIEGGIGTSGKNNPFFGKRHTKASLKKMSAVKLGKNNPFFGKHHTKKTLVKMVASSHRKSLFKNLLAEMNKRQMSYRDLAEILSLSRDTISDKMQSSRKFTVKDIAKLVEFFGLPAEYLMARVDDEFSTSKRYKTPFKNLIYEIDKKGFSYTVLAELLDVSLASISMKMHGNRKFTLEQVAKLEEIFGLPAEYLLKRD